MQNYYQILDVTPSSSLDEIKKSYYAKLKKFHPDVFDGDKTFAENQTALLNIAFDTLTDEKLRAKYNLKLSQLDPNFFVPKQQSTAENKTENQKFEQKSAKKQQKTTKSEQKQQKTQAKANKIKQVKINKIKQTKVKKTKQREAKTTPKQDGMLSPKAIRKRTVLDVIIITLTLILVTIIAFSIVTQ